MNVIGSRPDGWWRDRNAARRRLASRLAALTAASGDEITVVFDGSAVPDMAEGLQEGVRILYARRPGRDAADDRIVEEVAGDPNPNSLTVVTSDRDLVRRVRLFGANVTGPTVLLDRL
jgi:predicted RNA-binding protein with PIN domain